MKVLKKYESFEPEEEWVDYEDITFDFNRPVYDMFEIPFKINDRVHIETKNGPYGHTVTNGTIRAIYISNMREYSHVIISILLENERIVWDFNGIDYQVMITPLPINESFNPEEYWEEHEIIEPNKKYFVTKKNWSKLAKVLIENGYKWYSGEKISTKKIHSNDWENSTEILIYTYKNKLITYDTDFIYRNSGVYSYWEKQKKDSIKF